MKKLLRSSAVQTALGWLLAQYMRLTIATTRWSVEGEEHARPFYDASQGVAVCIWHQRFFLMRRVWPMDSGLPGGMIISNSPDGEFVAKAAKRIGVHVVRGSAANKKKSKDKGGLEALRAMAKHIKAGGAMGITPDGPRGPRMRAGPGPVSLARLTKAPLLPAAWSSNHRIVFKSWDRFMLPLPFGRGALVFGPPIPPPASGDAADLEATRAQLETALIAVTNRADALARVEITEPAPSPPPDAQDAVTADEDVMPARTSKP